MARGLCSNWKQVIGFQFVGTTVRSKSLQRHILLSVKKLEALGLKVRAVVCDQGPTNRAALSCLGMTKNNPSIELSGRNYLVIFDIPHLFKSLRNNFRKNLFVKVNGRVEASWQDVVEFYNLDKSQSLRLAPKLTDVHLNPGLFKKQNVRMAVQVLSHTVAAGLHTYASVGLLAATAMQTSAFLERVDKLFDILNSRTLHVNRKSSKPLSSVTSEEFKFLEESISWTKSWSFGKVLPFQWGLVNSIRAVVRLTRELLDEGFTMVFTSRFNQDCIEARNFPLMATSNSKWLHEL
ncbi:PREDICTED: uncharacterized protein LOC106817986 [Priapulus caudatus]|uniref:Uncharacterized protein LOC106817986 n=1 Tax=Priapulus caudatus TaxID=37621 RepID=A0ABM1F154_PRICU|nr:PREDICTED: uncharacterized protein LOC106817986 [Priapulus caudatus]